MRDILPHITAIRLRRIPAVKRAIGIVFICLFSPYIVDSSRNAVQVAEHPVPHHLMAITIDDLPSPYDDIETIHYVAEHLIPKIMRNGIPAVGFVNEYKLYVTGQIDERVAVLERWMHAGIELGNHTFSHIRIDDATVDEYEADVIRGETVTSWLMRRAGKKLRYFRHPQLRTGPTLEYKIAVDTFLDSRGYTVAPVTIDNDEYIFAAVYHRAKLHGDSAIMSRIASDYLAYMSGMIDHFEETSIGFLGRNINHILLLHANELNADYFDELIRTLTNRGYAFITLEEALSDPAYSLPESCSTKGISWLYRWMIAAGKEPPEQPRPSESMMGLFNTYYR